MTLFSTLFQSTKKRSYRSAFLAGCALSLFGVSHLNAEEVPAKSPMASAIDSLSTAHFEAIHIGKASTKKSDANARVGYQNWQMSLGSIDKLSQNGSARSLVNAGVRSSKLNWRQSPYFGTSEHHNLFVEGAHHFDLDLPVALHAHGRLETDIHARQISKYTMAFLTFWGSKEIDGSNYSLGLYKELGRHSKWLLPVIGLQTAISPTLQLDILLPFHAKVSYTVCEPCSLFAGVKSLKDRQKTQPTATAFSKSIWEYHTNVAHVGALYRYAEMGDASFELGRTLAPSVRVYDAEGRHQTTQRIGGSLFAQVSLNVWF
jgi:hypothetical protein